MLEKDHVRRAFYRIVHQQPNIRATKVIANWLFEPRSLFDPYARRRFKAEVLILLSYVALMAGVCATFNLR